MVELGGSGFPRRGNNTPKESSKLGLKAGPHRVAVRYTELKASVSKVVLMEPNAFAFLMKVQKERDDKALAKMVSGEDAEEETVEEVKEKTPEEEKRAKLTKILDISRIDLQEAGDDAEEETVEEVKEKTPEEEKR